MIQILVIGVPVDFFIPEGCWWNDAGSFWKYHCTQSILWIL